MSEEADRRLAAVMFTDMVGYTSLTQSNESLALQLLDTQSGIILPLVRAHHGTPIKTIGDAHLAEFASALAALECAVEIQSRVAEHDAAAPQEAKFSVRIGIHIGDVIHKGNDVLGDAVNIASRIQPIAEPGGICISQQVFDQVGNKSALRFVKLPFRQLKNVTTPIDVYKVVRPEPSKRAELEQELLKERVAVLPLSNFSASQQDEYLADGMTEELITAISGVEGLRVISRTSVMKFKNTQTDVSEIGRALNAGTILEGSFRKIGDRIRVTVQLIDARTEEHRWASNYDGDIKDIFNIQTDIANKVAQVLRGKLLSQAVPARKSIDIEAYEYYLKGRHFWNRRSKEGTLEALRLFKLAIEKDPTMAKAYSGVADCYITGKDNQAFPEDLAMKEAEDYVEKAIGIDAGIPEPHASYGLLLTDQRRYADAAVELKRALELNPSYASAHHWYAISLSNMGKLDQATEEAKLATQADPLSPPAKNILGVMHLYARRFDEALAVFDDNLKLDPNFSPSHAFKGNVLLAIGKEEEASKELEVGFRDYPEYQRAGFEAFAKCLFGHTDEAKSAIERSKRLAPNDKERISMEVSFQACLGDVEGFYRLIDSALDMKAIDPADVRFAWWLDKVRSDPRFEGVLKRLPT